MDEAKIAKSVAEKLVQAAYNPSEEFKSLIGWKKISGRAASKVAVELESVIEELEFLLADDDIGDVQQKLGRVAGAAETAAKEYANLAALASQMASRMGRRV